MTIGKVFLAAIVIAATAMGYAAYRPNAVEASLPAAGPLAHRLHDLAFGASLEATASAPKPAAPAGPQPIVVSVTTAKQGDFPLVLNGLGQVQAYNTVTVKARIDGQIYAIHFKEGQDVAKGDVLAQIDPRPFLAALDQARAKTVQDEANLANARLDLERYSTLAKQSFATQQQLDTQNALVNQLIAQIAADAAAIDAASVQLDYATIRAPISGRTGFRLVDEGNLVSASQQTAIVTIAQLQPISVVFTAPQEELGRIQSALASGEPKVTADASDGRELASGRLRIIDNQIDPSTATIRLKADFDNKDNALWPGLAVTTSLSVGAVANAIEIPTAAIQHGQKGLFVFVADDQNRAALRAIHMAAQDATTAAVSDGLKPGEKVIVTGQFLLQPGTPVTIAANASGS